MLLLFLIAFLLNGTLSAQVQVDVNFNNPSDLSTFFQADSSVGSVNSSSGGLANSGAVIPNGGDPEVWTFKTGLNVNPGDTIKASISFLLPSCFECIGGVGFSPMDSNNAVPGGFGAIENSVNLGLYTDFGSFYRGTNYAGASSSTSFGSPPFTSAGNWYHLRVTALQKSNDFLGYTMELYNLSPSGVLGSLMRSTTDSAYHPAVANASVLYPFFFTTNGEFPDPNFPTVYTAFDGASFSVSPPSSAAVPTLSTWGLIIMALVVLNGGAIALFRSSRAARKLT